MNAKVVAVVAVVAILVVGGVTATVLLNKKDSKDSDPFEYFDGVGLKVLGNIDKDNAITQKDYDEVKKLIDDGASAGDNKLADANNDGELNASDLEIIDKVIKGESTSIWHINYHDTDGNGTMDRKLSSTKFPVTSTIMTGSANNFIMFTLVGIPAGDVVKGASYSPTSNDDFLYSDSYLNTTKVESLGSSSTTIEFENGKIGSSNIIQNKSVTCLVTDWNRTYITNEDAFETAGVDVVRIAAASFEKDVYTHTIALLGLLFQKTENAKTIIDLYDSTAKDINDALANLPNDAKKKAVASSMNGAISSEGSDYTAMVVAAGAEFGLKGYDFGESTSVYVESSKGVFDTREYQYDNIVHIRTALTYGSTDAKVAQLWAEYANAMSLWEHAYDGQVLVSGTIPVPVRVALIAYAVYHDSVSELSKTWADSIRTNFENNYHIGSVDVSTKADRPLAITSWNFAVNIGPGVEVKDANNNTVVSGTSFPYGTQLSISATTPDPNYTLVALGSKVVDGKFLVVDTINAKYVKTTELNALSAAATKLAEYSGDGKYLQNVVANSENPGSVKTTNVGYSGPTSTRIHTFEFRYYDTVEQATAAYVDFTDSSTKFNGKDTDENYRKVDVSSITSTGMEILIYFSGSHTEGKAYTGSTAYFAAHYKNIVLVADANPEGSGIYQSIYSYDTALHSKTNSEIKDFFSPEATAFAQAIAAALKVGMGE